MKSVNLVKEASFLVIINTWFWPVFKQVRLAFIQQHLCKFNLVVGEELQVPPQRRGAVGDPERGDALRRRVGAGSHVRARRTRRRRRFASLSGAWNHEAKPSLVY